MLFDDRKDAGERLGEALASYRSGGALVLAIPRGGVEVAARVAEQIGAELSLLVARKLPFPDNPESGFGAVAEDGSTYINESAASGVARGEIEAIMERQKQEIAERIAVLRGGRPLPPIEGRTVILVDDGIAMGSTMRAAVQLCRNRNAGKVVVAVPVAGRRPAKEFERLADETVILTTPAIFQAVAQVYRNWYDVQDGEVIEILKRAES